MLGSFTKGMTIKIPARFQDNNKNPVTVENVIVRIEHFDKEIKNTIFDLKDQPMKKISQSDYLYEYQVPETAKDGTYIVHISAKVPQNNNKVFEAIEDFTITSSNLQIKTDLEESERIVNELPEYFPPDYIPPKVNYDNGGYEGEYVTISDLVVDVENKPMRGVHVNAYLKANFIPKDVNNVKVGSTMTDDRGQWVLALPRGEYVLQYKAIGHKELREFRKI